MEERLTGWRVPGFDHLADVGLEGSQVFIAEQLRRLGLLDRQLLAAGAKALEAPAELSDPWRAGTLGHGSLLEGAEVALERAVDVADLGVDRLQFGLALRPLCVLLGKRLGDRLAHQLLLEEDALELGEDRLLELLGGQAIVVTDFCTESLAREADVVGVATAVAVGSGANEALAAAGALNEPSKQVIGLVRAPRGCVLPALLKDRFGPFEELGCDKRLVGGRVATSSEGDLAEVGAISEHRQDRVAAPRPALFGAVAAIVEPAREGRRAFEALGIAAKQLGDDWRLGGIRFEEAPL